ncbi:MAG: hypothetical protein ABSH20_14105 [Tepidisphaeraceae bacterium]|jgi:hypothetical protein
MTLTIELDEELRAKAQTRAAESGYATLTEYLSSLVRADVDLFDSTTQLPSRVTVANHEDLEAKLGEGLDGSAREVTPADWEAEQIRQLRASRASKAD